MGCYKLPPLQRITIKCLCKGTEGLWDDRDDKFALLTSSAGWIKHFNKACCEMRKPFCKGLRRLTAARRECLSERAEWGNQIAFILDPSSLTYQWKLSWAVCLFATLLPGNGVSFRGQTKWRAPSGSPCSCGRRQTAAVYSAQSTRSLRCAGETVGIGELLLMHQLLEDELRCLTRQSRSVCFTSTSQKTGAIKQRISSS